MYAEYPLYNFGGEFDYKPWEQGTTCKSLRHGMDGKHRGKSIKARRTKNRIAKKSRQKNR